MRCGFHARLASNAGGAHVQDIALRMHLTDGESLQLTLNNGYYIRVRSMDDDCEERTDAHVCIMDYDQNISLFGVFDGHGGREVALCAAEEIPKLIKNDLYRTRDYSGALKKAFMDFDEYLLTMDGYKQMRAFRGNRQKNPRRGDASNDKYSSDTSCGYTSGATAVVMLLVNSNRMYVAHVGDTACIVSDHYIRCSFVTKDHCPRYEPELSRIQAAGGAVIHGRVNLDLTSSRSLGDHLYKGNSSLSDTEQIIIGMPDVNVRDIQPTYGRYILIASSGVWNAMSRNGAAVTVSEYIESQTVRISGVCRRLIGRCIAPTLTACNGRGLQNMTCILIKFKKSPVKKCIVSFDGIKL